MLKNTPNISDILCMVLNTLIFIYGSVLVLSTIIAIFLWVGYRHDLLKKQLILWTTGIICFLAQGIFNNFELSGFLAFALNWATVIYFLGIFSDASEVKLPFKIYHQLLLAGLILSTGLFVAKFSFQIAALPFCISNAVVLFHGAFKGLQLNQKVNYVNYGFCTLLFLDGLHFLDYPFLRPSEDLAVVGFSITLILFFCVAVYVPMFILKKLSDDYTLGLKEEVSKRTLQLVESNQLLKNAFENLSEKNNQLEDLSKRNQGLMSILVHDMSNPLQVIFQNCELLFSQPQKFVSDIQKRSERMNKAIDSVNYTLKEAKSFHNVSLGKSEVVLETILLKQIIIDSVDLFKENLMAKKINLQLELNDIDNSYVQLNSHWLKNHVLTNLISNAIKFSQVGGLIEISAKMLEPNKISIFIKDFGVGISPDKKNQIFDFHSMTTSRGTRGEVGSGLGLPIVKQYLELMGGSIELCKQSDLGTCFRIDLIKDFNYKSA